MSGYLEFTRLALDPTRLALLGMAATGPVDVDAAARRLHIERRAVLRALSRLRAAALIDGDGLLNRSALHAISQSLPRPPPMLDSIGGSGWTVDELETLRRFFSGARLTALPSHREKRRVVIERLAQEFEPGMRYTEKEVDFILQRFWHDHATLRRYLVDEGYLDREGGEYWRSGGRL